ncbi:MAG: HEAT repeat domain-containing protein [Planctomycetaceae bacterium]|nr:HEAT repeat domain-containing protein [Planctomycetaceae bacterium]
MFACRRIWWTCCVLGLLSAEVCGDGPVQARELDESLREQCVKILRDGLSSDDFWPAMHAAEGLTFAGFGTEVRKALIARLATETDDQHRCGLARELVRAGDLAHVQTLVAVLAGPNDYGHTHACESLFKVRQLGDKVLLQQTLRAQTAPKLALMAAAALTRQGDAAALRFIRERVPSPDGETAKNAAWILARVGDTSDLPGLRAGRERFTDPLIRAYFEHALAALGDAEGQAALVRNLSHADPVVRVSAAEFAPDARVSAARPAIVARLEDEIPDVRFRAAHALLALSTK